MDIKGRIKSEIKKYQLKKKNVLIKGKAIIENSTIFEGDNVIYEGYYRGYIGFGTYFAPNCRFLGKIGRYCSVAQRVTVIQGFHPTKQFVSTSPCFYSTLKQTGFSYVTKNIFKEFKFAKDDYECLIGNDVHIGENVNIMAGVKIGDGAICGACALITKDVPPYAIVAGVPARVIGYRFSQEDIDFLLKFRWWDKGETWIKEHAYLFDDINKLKEYSYDHSKNIK